MFEGNKNKFRNIGSSVVLSGAVLNSAIVSTGQVSAIKSLLYYMNQCWFLRYLVNLICSVPFFTDPFQKVFCVPERDSNIHKLPESFYSSLVKYEGRSTCMPRYLLENIIDEKSKEKFKEMLEKHDDLCDEYGCITVRFIKVSEDGRLCLQIENFDRYDEILVTKRAASDINKIGELCKYLDSVASLKCYRENYGEFERVFYSIDGGVPDDRLKKCIGRSFMIAVDELYEIVPPSYREKLSKVINSTGAHKGKEEGKVRIYVKDVNRECTALSFSLGFSDDDVVWTKGLTGNKEAVRGFLEYFQQNSSVFDMRLRECVHKSLEIKISELKKIVEPNDSVNLDGMLKNAGVKENKDGKVRIYVEDVNRGCSALSFSLDPSDDSVVWTKSLTDNEVEYLCKNRYFPKDPLKECVGRSFMIAVDELYKIVSPYYQEKLNKVFSYGGVHKDKEGKVKIYVRTLNSSGSLGISVGFLDDGCFVWTKSLTGNEKVGGNLFVGCLCKQSSGVFDIRLRECVHKSLEIKIGELKKIVAPNDRVNLDGMLKNAGVKENKDGKVRIYVKDVNRECSALSFSLGPSDDSVVWTKSLTSDEMDTFLKDLRKNKFLPKEGEDGVLYLNYGDDNLEDMLFG